MTTIKFQASVTGKKYGYVYVMSYPGSDKLKIGHSLDPFDRAEDIGGTKAPEVPVVEAFFWCSERREDVERSAHRLAQESRHNGEWFAISVEEAIGVIRAAADLVNVEIQLVYDRDERKPKLEVAPPDSRESALDEAKRVERQAAAARQDAWLAAKAEAERQQPERPIFSERHRF
jgi:hypothetical protein